MRRKLDEWWPLAVRYAGLAIALYETVVEKVDRPSLLILAAGMMGLPTVLRWQMQHNEDDYEDEPPPPRRRRTKR